MTTSNFERGVLLTLFEACEETLPSLLNTVKKDFSKHLSVSEFELQIDKILQKFLFLGFIGLAYRSKEGWNYLSEDEISKILPSSNCLEYNINDNRWQWNDKEFGSQRVTVLLEQKGIEFIKKNIS